MNGASRRVLWTGLGLLALATAVGLAAGSGLAHRTVDPGARGPLLGPAPPVTPETAGIELVSLRTSARGRLLDLRYVVRAPARAARALDGDAYLLDAEGRVLRVPVTAKVGSLRPRPRAYDEGRTYYALFANPGGRLGAGAEVTVVLGGMQAAGVRVE